MANKSSDRSVEEIRSRILGASGGQNYKDKSERLAALHQDTWAKEARSRQNTAAMRQRANANASFDNYLKQLDDKVTSTTSAYEAYKKQLDSLPTFDDPYAGYAVDPVSVENMRTNGSGKADKAELGRLYKEMTEARNAQQEARNYQNYTTKLKSFGGDSEKMFQDYADRIKEIESTYRTQPDKWREASKQVKALEQERDSLKDYEDSLKKSQANADLVDSWAKGHGGTYESYQLAQQNYDELDRRVTQLQNELMVSGGAEQDYSGWATDEMSAAAIANRPAEKGNSKELQAQLEQAIREREQAKTILQYAQAHQADELNKEPGFELKAASGEEKFKAFKQEQAPLRESWEANAGYATDEMSAAAIGDYVPYDPRLYSDYREPDERWTEDEKKRFYYLFDDEKTRQQAYDYAIGIDQKYNRSDAEARDWSTREFATRNFGTGAMASAVSVPANLIGGGVDYLRMALENSARGGVYETQYDGWSRWADTTRSAISEKLNESGTISKDVPVLGGKGLGDLYQLMMSMADSSVAVMAGGGAANAVFFGSAAASTTRDALERGIPGNRAVALGFAAGVAEVAGETLSVEHLLKQGDIADYLRHGLLREMAKQGGVEASEEVLTSILNMMADAVINGDQAELQQKVYVNVANGMAYDEAVRQASKEWLEELGTDALGGFLSGGLMSGGRLALQSGAAAVTKYQGDTQGILSMAGATEEGSRARDLAARYQQRYDKKGSLTNLQAAKLQAETQADINKADRPKLLQAVQDHLKQDRFSFLDKNEIRTMAEKIVDRVQTGEKEGKWTALEERIYSETATQLAGENVRTGNWLDTSGLKSTQARELATQRLKMVETKGGTRAEVKNATMKDGKLQLTIEENGEPKVLSQDELNLDEYQQHALETLTNVLGDDAAAAYNSMTSTGRYGRASSIEEYAVAFGIIRDTFGRSTDAQKAETAALASPLRKGLTDAQVLQAIAIGQKHMQDGGTVEQGARSARGTGKVSLNGGTLNDGTVLKGVKNVEKVKGSKEYRAIKEFARMLGIDVVLFESEAVDKDGNLTGAQGAYQDGVIYLDWNAGMNNINDTAERMLLRTMSHELTHFIQQNATKEYAELKSFVTRYLAEAMGENYRELVMEKMNGRNNISYEEALDEVVADACETMLRDSQYVNRLMHEHRSLWDRIRKWIRQFLKRITAQDKGAIAMQGVVNELREIWDLGLQAAVESRTDVVSVGSTEGRQAVEKLSEGGQKIVESLGKDAEIQVNKDGEMEVAKSADGQTVAYSERTYYDGGKQKLIQALKENGHTQEEIDAVIENIEATVEFLEKLAQQYSDSHDYQNLKRNLYATITTNIKTGKQVLSALVKNGDYPVNIDLQLICKKRVAYMRMLTRLVDDGIFEKVDFKDNAIADLNKILRDGGFETACLGCFVESRRLQIQAWAEDIVNDWNAAVDARNPDAGFFNFAKGGNKLSQMEIAGLIDEMDKAGEKNKQGNLNLQQGSVAVKMGRLQDQVKSLRQHLTVADLLTPEGMRLLRSYDKNLYSLVLQRWGANTPKIVQEFNPYNGEIAQLTFDFAEEMTGKAVSGKSKYQKMVKSELKQRKGESKEEYNRRVETEAIRRYLYDIGGARIQSFSDFMIENVFDYMQIVADLAANRFPMHGYTKEAICLRLFGMTGAKWNGSLIAHVEKSMGKEYAGLLPVEEASNGRGIVVEVDGKKYAICFDDYARNQATGSFIQSIGMKDIIALQLDPRYSKNVGSITIGVSDKQIWAMLDSPYFRMVIPYHSSGMDKHPVFAELMGVSTYNDYEPYQNTRVKQLYDMDGNAVKTLLDSKGKPVSINTHFDFNAELQKTGNARTAANNYLAWCRGHDVYDDKGNKVGRAVFTPKFSDVHHKNQAPVDFTQHPNYYKLLEDFNVYDSLGEASAMQGAVTMTLPSEATRLTPEQMTAYKQALRDTGLYTEKEITKYAKKADMTFQELIAEEVGNRADYESRQAKVWDDTVDKAEKMLLEKYGRETNAPQLSTRSTQTAEEVEAEAEEMSDVRTQYSVRQGQPPKKTMIGYKVFMADKKHPGQLYPTKVKNPGGQGTPVGVWLDADTGEIARNPDGSIKTNTRGRISVKANGGTLAWRPGWHLGSLPEANQMNRVDPNNPESDNSNRGTTGLMWDNYIFCECEFAADEDYQLEAFEFGTDEKGRYNHSQAGLPYIPKDGYYKYRTNPDPSTAPWFISGSIRITKILDDDMRREIIEQWNAEHPDQQMRFTERYSGKPINLADYGLKAGPVAATEDLSSVAPGVDYSDEIRNLPGYTRHALNFDDPNVQEAFRIQQIEDRKDYYIDKYNREHRDELEKGSKKAATTGGRVQFSTRDRQHNNWAPTFYSKMQNVITDWTNGKGQPLPPKMSAQQVVGWLKGKGVKAEEIRWSGIVPWMEGRKTVTRDELLQVMAENQINIETKVLEQGEDHYLSQYEWDGLEYDSKEDVRHAAEAVAIDMGIAPALLKEHENSRFIWYRRSDNDELVIQFQKEKFGGETRWSEYTTDGGENYREILFKMPGLMYTNEAMQVHWGDSHFQTYADENDARTDQNIIAHARIQDMRSGQKTLLLVEEIQSDLHNAGIKKGFSANRTELESKKKAAIERHKKAQESFEQNERKQAFDLAEDILLRWQKTTKHPNYNIDSFALGEWLIDGEYLLTDDFEYAYDARDEIEAIITPAEWSAVNAIREKYKEIDRLKEERRNVGRESFHERQKAPDVPFAGSSDTYHEYVMKHLLRLAAEGNYDAIAWTTADMQSDRWSDEYAEGYRIEYDQNIPKFMQKYVKQWGAKVGRSTLASTGDEVWSVDINDAMRKSVLTEGQPLFSMRGGAKTDTQLLENRIAELEKQGALDSDEAFRAAETIYDLSLGLDKANSTIKSMQKTAAKVRRDRRAELINFKRLSDNYHEKEREVNAALQELDRLVQHSGDRKAIQAQRAKVSAKEQQMAKALERLTQAKGGSEIQEILRQEREIQMQRTQDRIRDSIDRRDLRKRISKLWKDLNREVTGPTEGKHIPPELMQQTLDVLEALNMDTSREGSKAGEKLRAKLDSLRARYEELRNDGHFKKAAVYDAQVAEYLTNMIAQVGDTPINKMSVAQMETVLETLSAMVYTARRALKLKLGEQELEAYKVSEAMTKETRSVEKPKTGFLSTWLNAQLSPERMFNRLGGYSKDSYWGKVYGMLNEGQLKQTRLQMEGSLIFEDLMEKENEKNFRKLLDPKNTVDIGLKDENGEPVLITHGMMISLYMHLQNDQNIRHIAYGGLTIPALQDYYNGKKVRGNERATRVGGALQEIAEINDRLREAEDADEIAELEQQRDEAAIRAMGFVEGLREEIDKQLTDYDRQWIAASKELFDGFSKRELNKTTLDVYGIKRANVENYYPIWVDGDFLNTPFETVAKDLSLENAGFMKERIDSSKPIRLADVTDVTSSQIRKVAQYCGLMPAIRGFNKVWGKTQTGYRDSLQKAVHETFGQAGVKYVENLMADLNGARGGQDSALGEFLNRMRGHMAQASLTMSLRVAMGQTASYPTAAAVVGWGPLMKALAHGGRNNTMISRADQELIRKWSPLLYYRMKGYSTTELGDIAGMNDKFSRLWKKARWLTGWIQAMDGATVGRLWYAAEYYVQDHNKALVKGTDAYYEAVAKVFNDIVEKTQPDYTTMQRPDILRSPNALVKQLTMFLTQRLQNFNILYDAAATYSKYKADFKAGRNDVTTEDVRQAGIATRRAVVSQLAAAATITAFKFLADAVLHSLKNYRDDDDELTKQSVSLEILDMFMDSLAGNVLGGGEIYDLIESKVFGKTYYGIEVSGLATVTDLVDAFSSAFDHALKGELSWKDADKLARNLATVAGIPYANAKKFVQAGIWYAQDVRNGEWLWESNAGISRSTGQQASRLYRAYTNGDGAKVKQILEEIPEDKQKDVYSAVRKLIREQQKSGELNVYEAMRQMKNYGGSTDQIMNDYIRELYKDGALPKADAIKYLQEYAGKTKEAATKAVTNVDGKQASGVNYNDIDDMFKIGKMSAEDARKALVDYGIAQDTANMKVEYWSYQQKNPGTAMTTEDRFETYWKKYRPVGMTPSMYDDFYAAWNAVQGTDKNHDGKADANSKKPERIAIIDSLPLSREQKDALFSMEWKTGLQDAPWNK